MIQRKYYKTIRVIIDSDGGGTPFYIENVDTVPGDFALYKSGTTTYTPNLNYRIDNGEWFEYDMTNLPLIEVPIGSKIYLKGNNPNGFNQNSSAYYEINFYKSSTYSYCKCNIGGYITSLLALENFHLIDNIPNYTFNHLLDGNTGLKSAETLITSNITSVGNSSFKYCFNNCSSLVTAPTFENVTSTMESSFECCFQGCTSLVTAPMFERVTSVGNTCFSQCFINCTSLVTAPTFENVISVGRYGLQSCFQGCTSLVTAPNFRNLTSASEIYCFRNCFSNCISLGIIIAPRPSSWSTSYFTDWVKDIPSTGTFYKKKGLEIPTGTSGIPEGWTVVEEA